MAINNNVININLEADNMNKASVEPFLQGSTNSTLNINLLRHGVLQTVESNAKIELTILYNVDDNGVSENGYVLKLDDSDYDITVSNGQIVIPLREEITINTGTNNLILKIEETVKEFIHSLDVYSVKVNFTNKTQIVIDHNRKDIYYLKIMNYDGTVGNVENYQDVTSTVKITETIERNQQGDIIKKQIIIDSNQPITGYLLYI